MPVFLIVDVVEYDEGTLMVMMTMNDVDDTDD